MIGRWDWDREDVVKGFLGIDFVFSGQDQRSLLQFSKKKNFNRAWIRSRLDQSVYGGPFRLWIGGKTRSCFSTYRVRVPHNERLLMIDLISWCTVP